MYCGLAFTANATSTSGMDLYDCTVFRTVLRGETDGCASFPMAPAFHWVIFIGELASTGMLLWAAGHAGASAWRARALASSPEQQTDRRPRGWAGSEARAKRGRAGPEPSDGLRGPCGGARRERSATAASI
jgi:hypothetical protein